MFTIDPPLVYFGGPDIQSSLYYIPPSWSVLLLTLIPYISIYLNPYCLSGCWVLLFCCNWEAGDSIDDLIDWCAEATAESAWEEHGFTSRTVATRAYKAMYRHQWAMNHFREKAEHPLLNIQHALPEQAMSQAAQYQAHCERRAAYARRCCSKASHNFHPSAGAGGRKRARCAARVGGGG